MGKGMLALMGASLAVLGAATAEAQTVYSNGPIDGTQSAWTVNYGYAVSNSFTLASATTITGFTLGAWSFPGDDFTAVDYGFSTSPNYAITGNAALTSSGAYTNGFGFTVATYTGSITPITLAAGTYWFSLQNATVSNGDPVYWDINNGPSHAYENTIGDVTDVLFPGSNSSAVTLTGSAASPAPEPASWAMMVGGFGLVGGAMRARRKLAVSFVRA